jgi:hypothetical protein
MINTYSASACTGISVTLENCSDINTSTAHRPCATMTTYRKPHLEDMTHLGRGMSESLACPNKTSDTFFKSPLILSAHQRLVLHSCLFPSGFYIKMYSYSFTFVLHTRPSHPPWLDHPNVVKSARHEASYWAVYSNLLSLHPSSNQIFSSAPCSQTRSLIFPYFKRAKFKFLFKFKCILF